MPVPILFLKVVVISNLRIISLYGIAIREVLIRVKSGQRVSLLFHFFLAEIVQEAQLKSGVWVYVEVFQRR